MTGPSWTDMPREAFDADASLGGLFDLEPGMVPARDACGTGDLLSIPEIGEDAKERGAAEEIAREIEPTDMEDQA